MSPWNQQTLSTFTILLGKDIHENIDEGMIALIYRYNNDNLPNTNYEKNLELGIKNQLALFEETEGFRYYCYLVYLLIYINLTILRTLIYAKEKIVFYLSKLLRSLELST